MSKQRIPWGMPMERAEGHAVGDATRAYWEHCARPDGSMQPYDEKVEAMNGFIVRGQRVDQEKAREIAKEMMARLPARRNTPAT